MTRAYMSGLRKSDRSMRISVKSNIRIDNSKFNPNQEYYSLASDPSYPSPLHLPLASSCNRYEISLPMDDTTIPH